jgi:hypothetical protein
MKGLASLVGLREVLGADPPEWHAVPPSKGCAYCGADRRKRSEWTVRAVCISMSTQPERLERAMEEAHRVGLCTRLVFYRPPPVTAPAAPDNMRLGNGQYGCWESHRVVNRLGPQMVGDDGPLLVLEDDFRFLENWNAAKCREICRRMLPALPRSWDAYYLGHIPLYGGYPIKRSVWRLRPLMTHAYIVSHKGRRAIAESVPAKHRQPCGIAGVFDAWCAANLIAYGHMPGLVGQTSTVPRRSMNGKERFIDFHCRHNALVEWAALLGAPIGLAFLLAASFRWPVFVLLLLAILFAVLAI